MDTTFPDLRQYGGADAFLRECQARIVFDMFTNKWAGLAMGALLGGPRRFNELRRMLDGVTQKMLAQTLRALERDGLVTRTVYPTIPPRVEYELTELGRSASAMLRAIGEWSGEHADEMIAARRAYDERAARPVEPVRA
ncbi:winged helix-turn-helix transcriptional regulator [Nonomuraea muscovyensis]|jgi:DNA-binding HxlR family transcriptional regulator|uniref:DNA-binding HxlR family transcriptional regulator n=1 Tax=Nonomuraea muscovyensis TaxID=1124761 RepID=A0A7X0C0C4_9ACTN|nr:helix-turn-helix domain-containing protein [Nonomuraea muscovyensis]MBB6344309.1 DNA-binding HxlR family transcriptional regulator [Nonomuraea muscovyensis]MDF2710849.1 transcriptional regulator [Nonomuraea muscovyensis]